MKLNEIFTIDNYSDAIDFVLKNNYTINEIEPNENGRRFQIVEIPQPTAKELAEQEINVLKHWYNVNYTQHEQKYRRLHSLGKLTDEGKDPYNELIKLYNEAEIKRARIQELERLLSDSSK